MKKATMILAAAMMMMSASWVSAQGPAGDLGLDLDGDSVFKQNEKGEALAKPKPKAQAKTKADANKKTAKKIEKPNKGKHTSAIKQAAADTDHLDEMIVYMVSSQFIASRAELRRIDRTPVPELIVIANDRRKKPQVRQNAIKCMSLFRDKQVKAAFSEMTDGRADKYFPFIAMAYLEAFGEDAVDDLSPFLNDRKSEVRMTIVKGFGIFGGQKGYDLLVERDKKENNPNVLAQIRNYIQ